MGAEAYTYVDWVSFITNQISTSGYYMFMGDNLVTWRSKKQLVVAKSSAEAKSISMAQGIYEQLWIRMMLFDLGMKLKGPMKLYCSNKLAISIAHNPIHHDQTKDMEIGQLFITKNWTVERFVFPMLLQMVNLQIFTQKDFLTWKIFLRQLEGES